MSGPPVPRHLHMRSAVIGAQLVVRAMGGSQLPPDTAEGYITSQMAHHNLVRFDGDLSQCTQHAANLQEIRRAYVMKLLEVMFLRRDTGITGEQDEEALIRKSWRLAQVMMEEDQVAAQLTALSPAKAT